MFSSFIQAFKGVTFSTGNDALLRPFFASSLVPVEKDSSWQYASNKQDDLNNQVVIENYILNVFVRRVNSTK